LREFLKVRDEVAWSVIGFGRIALAALALNGG
jgi:hypothetical protein